MKQWLRAVWPSISVLAAELQCVRWALLYMVDSRNMKLIYLQFVRLVRVYGTHMRADACLHVYVGM